MLGYGYLLRGNADICQAGLQIAPAALMEKLGGVRQYISFSLNAPASFLDLD